MIRPGARAHFDRAIALCESEDTTQLTQFVTEDPPAFVRLFSALNWWLLGESERAEAEAEAAFASRPVTHHAWAAKMISQWSASTLAMFRRDTVATLERSAYGIGLAEAGGYGLGIPYMNVCQGWAMALEGEVDGHRQAPWTGCVSARPEVVRVVVREIRDVDPGAAQRRRVARRRLEGEAQRAAAAALRGAPRRERALIVEGSDVARPQHPRDRRELRPTAARRPAVGRPERHIATPGQRHRAAGCRRDGRERQQPGGRECQRRRNPVQPPHALAAEA